jgi:GNAT superfamily N-acetyltransferase
LYTVAGFAATTLSAAGVLERIKEGPIWLAISDEAPVGTAAAIKQDTCLYVRGMAVSPAARGQKLGEALLIEIEDYAITRHCDRLLLRTTPFLDRAIRLYHRFGFSQVADDGAELFGTPLLTMEKRLTNRPGRNSIAQEEDR